MAKNIVMGITGGIAAYKSPDIISRLRKAGFNVWVILTKNGAEFVTPLALETMSGNPVVVDMFDRDTPWEVEHISLAKRADLFLIAPATANILGKMVSGVADDMLSTTIMATTAPILIAPAMNNNMYESEATQHNLKSLKKRGIIFLGPEYGRLAEGGLGIGRMSEPWEIVDRVVEIFTAKLDLFNKKILITAGPTREYIDPVRYISNPSTGKMGYALAQRAKDRGGDVTLISGPVNIEKPDDVNVINVSSSDEMYDSVMSIYKDYDVIIKAAAPADYRPKMYKDSKIKKQDADMVLELSRTRDIAKSIGEDKGSIILVTFAAETDEPINNAKMKLKKKNADFVVVNDITKQGAGFGTDTNIVSIVSLDKVTDYDKMDKLDLADIILDEVITLFQKNITD